MIIVELHDKNGIKFFQNANYISTITPLRFGGGSLIILEDGRQFEVTQDARDIVEKIFIQDGLSKA